MEKDIIEMNIDSQQNLSEFVLHVKEGISKHYLDDTLSFIWANSGFYKKLGYGEKEFLFRFPNLKKYGEVKSYDFEPMITHFQNAYDSGHDSAAYQICMPIRNKTSVWLKASATFIAGSKDTAPIVYIFYHNIHEIIEKQKEMYIKEKERKENFEWLMSEYAGNVYISDIYTHELLYLNKTSCETLQMSKEQVIGKKCYEIIQGRDAPCPFCTNACLEKSKSYEWEFFNPNLKRSLIIKDRIIDWEGHKARIELADDMRTMVKIQERKNREKEIILKTIPAGMVRIDARDHHLMLWYNDKFLSMLEYTKSEFEVELLDRCSYMHPDDFKRLSASANEMKKTGDNVVLEVRTYTRSKEERNWMITLCYISGEDSWDGVSSFYCISLDVTANKNTITETSHIVEKDALTGIYNRAETEKQIEEYIIKNANKKGALFMVDTDDFKWINDSKGHMVGDFVLAEMADGMKKIMREDDIVGRIGGDEFIIFMKNIMSTKDVEKKVNELLMMFHHLFEEEKSPVSVTCSIGVSMYPKDGDSFKALYAKADQALYQVKSQGKDNYLLYESVLFEGIKDNSYSYFRTEIESEKLYAEGGNQLTNYIFRTLYQSDNMEHTIDLILEVIGKQFDVSRAYIFENSDDNLYTSNTYEWCNEGIPSEIANLQNLSYSMYGNYDELFGEDTIFYCRDIHSLKPEQEALFAEQGICSTLQCAILDDERLSGIIGFDECTGKRLWTQEEIDSLSLIAQILSIFLQRKKIRKVKQDLQHHQMILNNLDDCIYVIENGSDALLYKNAKFEKYHPEYALGQACYIDSYKHRRMPILWEGKEAFLCCVRY